MHGREKSRISRRITTALLGIGAVAAAVLLAKRPRARLTEIGTDSDGCAPGRRESAIAELRPGDILLFHDARGLNKLITRATHSPFYHAGLYAGDGRTVEARTRGVIHGDLRGRENAFLVVPAPKDRGDAALSWAFTKVGDGYDLIDVGLIILDRICGLVQWNYTPGNRYSCGEFVALAYDNAGVQLFPGREPALIVPGDFGPLVPLSRRIRDIYR